MVAYVIVHYTVKDQEKLEQYRAGAGPTLGAFGGEFMTVGTVTEVLHGSHDHQSAVLLKFPDANSVHKWYNSDAYQAIIPTRSEAIDTVFIAIEEAEQ